MKTNKLYFLLAALLLASCGNDDEPIQVLDTTKVSQVEDFVDERDGHVYKCVKLGNQIWMAENLAYYHPEGVMGGCYTWDEAILEEEKITAQMVVDNDTWCTINNDLAYYESDDIYYDSWSARLAVKNKGWTQEEAEDYYLKKYPDFYAKFKAALLEAAPSRESIIKKHSDNAEAGNGGYATKNGYLYTLDAAKASVPEGWRIPSDEDWKKLEAFLGIPEAELDNMNAWRGNNAGDFLKIGGGSLFEARYAGCNAWIYGKTMSYIRQNYSAYFWASDESTTIVENEGDEEDEEGGELEPEVIREGIVRQLAIYSSAIWRGMSRLDNGYRGVAYSVRCVKDAN